MSDNYDHISECFFQMDPVNSKLVAQIFVAHFSVTQISVADFTIYRNSTSYSQLCDIVL